MSAIFGILHLTGKPAVAGQLQKMQNKLAHYGPAQQAFTIDENIGLGCCLNSSINPLTSDIPICEQEGLVLVGDALIYNTAALLDQLNVSGPITTQALLLEAYKKWGAGCPKHINGDFAFAVWAKQANQLMIFRDHLGVRPLYYFFDGAVFAFATDMRALLALPFVGREFDEVALYATITETYHTDPEATYFARIKRLRQAHLLKVTAQGLSIQKYWTPGKSKITFKDEADCAAMLYDLVSDAVNLRVAQKAKIGAELSGGLDSSVISILANRALQAAGKEIAFFSWSPLYEVVEQQPGDERQQVATVCRQEGLSCQFYDPRLPLPQDAEDILPQFEEGKLFQQEYQFMASQGVQIILTGWGGDQAASHRANLFSLFVNGEIKHFGAEAKYLARGSIKRLLRVVADNTVLSIFNSYINFGSRDKDWPDIVNKQFAARLKQRCKKDPFYLYGNPVKYIESGEIQARTELTAWLGAYHGLQHVYPLLDYRLVDYALSLPRHLFYKRGLGRYLFRKAFASILPPEVCNFLSKNDAAKYKYGLMELEAMAGRLRSTAASLRRDLFAAYIDWDQLEGMVANPLFNTDLSFHMYALFIIHPLYYMQKILADADRE
ncbi:MAG: asparagine synthase-related protein [Firmicutes bacterium]|nr:asparagine synthase-related protein [Bacillota bacterium]